MPDRNEIVEVHFLEVVNETEKAYLLLHEATDLTDEDKPEIWWPKSQMEDFSEEDGVAYVPRWLAEDKGVILS